MTTENRNQGPLQTFRNGSVVIKLWQHDTQDRTYINASVGRIFKDKTTGEFKETRTFTETDLLKIQDMLPEVRQEQKKWLDYYKEIDRQQQTAPPQAPEQEPEQALAAQRDAVIAAAPNQQNSQPSQEQSHAPVKEHSR